MAKSETAAATAATRFGRGDRVRYAGAEWIVDGVLWGTDAVQMHIRSANTAPPFPVGGGVWVDDRELEAGADDGVNDP